MEKNTPQCPLATVKSLVKEGKIRATGSALAGGAALGINFNEMKEIVLNLTMADFYKSMTTHNDHRVWQDVYHPNTSFGEEIYLKLTVIDDVLIVSFKEL